MKVNKLRLISIRRSVRGIEVECDAGDEVVVTVSSEETQRHI